MKIPDLSEETYDDLEMTVTVEEESDAKRALKEAVRVLGFAGNLNNLWSEIFARLDFFNFVMEEAPHRAFKDLRFLTFEKLDPYHFLLIEAFRRPLVAKQVRTADRVDAG